MTRPSAPMTHPSLNLNNGHFYGYSSLNSFSSIFNSLILGNVCGLLVSVILLAKCKYEKDYDVKMQLDLLKFLASVPSTERTNIVSKLTRISACLSFGKLAPKAKCD